MLSRWLTVSACVLLLGGSGAAADEKSDALLKKAAETAAGYKTLEAVATFSSDDGGHKQSLKATLSLMKPNYGRFRMLGPDGAPMQSMVADGKSLFMVMDRTKEYMKRPGARDLAPFPLAQEPFGALFAPKTFFASAEHRFAGKQTVEGKSYDVVEFTRQQAPSGKAFVGASGMVEGVELVQKMGEQQSTTGLWLKNLKLNTPMTPQQFAFKPGPGFKIAEAPNFEKSLLAVGAKAPDFQLSQPGGGRLALSDALQGKKAVLINFWFHG